MKTCLLLAFICSAIVINGVNSKTYESFKPTDYTLEITPFKGVTARDVGVGADGTIWIVSNIPNGNVGFDLYKLVPGTTAWKQVGGRGTRISVAPNGLAWMVQTDNDIFMHNGKNWTSVAGVGSDISCSPDGNVFLVHKDNTFSMLKRDSLEWEKFDGSGLTLAGGNSQSLWAINENKEISRLTAVGWEKVGDNGVDIASGKNGLTWVVNNAAGLNQFQVFDESNQRWIVPDLEGYAAKTGTKLSTSPTTRIAVDPNGDLIGIRKDLSMYRLSFTWGQI